MKLICLFEYYAVCESGVEMPRKRANPDRYLPPSGPAWSKFRPQVFRRWGLVCYHCEHAIRPGAGEVEHLISPGKRPDLAWDLDNLRPTHGSTAKRPRCPTCNLACNSIAAGNQAPRDADGRSLPFPPEFIAQKRAELSKGGPRRQFSSRRTQPAKPAPPAPPPAPVSLPDWAVDIQPGGRYFCDQLRMERGRVIDREPGSGCMTIHSPGDEGRCW